VLAIAVASTFLVGALTAGLCSPIVLGMDIWQALDSFHAFQYFRVNFSHCLLLHPDDISKNNSEFQAWFTPGVAVIPWLVQTLTGVSQHDSHWMVNVVFLLSALSGFFVLLRQIGFSMNTTILSVSFYSSNLLLLMPFCRFKSNDIYLLGYYPWVLLLHHMYRNRPNSLALLVLLLGPIGFFLKSSFLLIYLNLILAFLSLSLLRQNWRSLQISELLRAGFPLVSFGIVYAVCYFLFIAHGEHSGHPRMLTFHPAYLVTTFSGPVTSIFSMDRAIDILNAEHLHEFLLGPEQYWLYGIYASVSVAAVAIYRLVWSMQVVSVQFRMWLLVFIFFTITSTLFLHITASGIDFTSRPYALSGFLLVPFMVEYGSSSVGKGSAKTLLMMFILSTSFVFSYSIFTYQKIDSKSIAIGPVSGFRIRYLNDDSEILGKLKDICASADDNSVVMLPSYGMSLEFSDVRPITNYENWDLESQLTHQPEYGGTVDKLLILSRKEFGTGSAQLYLSKFTDYHSVECLAQSSSFQIFELMPQRQTP